MDKPWLFILGCNNSGTTLLYNLLGRHPQIDPLKKEGQDSPHMPFTNDYRDDYGFGLNRVWTEKLGLFRNPDVKNIERLTQSWLNMRASKGGKYIMEKSPPDAVRSLWLQEHFSPAWFVGIVRNGYAVCEGIKRKKGGAINYERAARHWAKANEVMLNDSKKLMHFKLFRYEDLTENTEKTMQSLEKYLDLSQHDYSDTGIIDLGYSHFSPSKIVNMNQKSINALDPNQREIIHENAKEMLERFYYEL